MKRFALALGVATVFGFLAILGTAYVAHGDQTIEVCGPRLSVAERISDSFVALHTMDGKCRGSGFLIAPDGEQLVMTACHVAETFKDKETGKYDAVRLLKADDNGETSWYGDVVYSDENGPDVALVRPRMRVPHLAADLELTDKLRLGEPAYYCGTPAGYHGLFEQSIVSQPHVYRDKCDFFMVNGCGYFGSSGSGVYVLRGGKPVAVGVVVRLAWGRRTEDGVIVLNKAPMLCETQAAMASVLKTYKGK